MRQIRIYSLTLKENVYRLSLWLKVKINKITTTNN